MFLRRAASDCVGGWPLVPARGEARVGGGDARVSGRGALASAGGGGALAAPDEVWGVVLASVGGGRLRRWWGDGACVGKGDARVGGWWALASAVGGRSRQWSRGALAAPNEVGGMALASAGGGDARVCGGLARSRPRTKLGGCARVGGGDACVGGRGVGGGALVWLRGARSRPGTKLGVCALALTEEGALAAPDEVGGGGTFVSAGGGRAQEGWLLFCLGLGGGVLPHFMGSVLAG